MVKESFYIVCFEDGYEIAAVFYGETYPPIDVIEATIIEQDARYAKVEKRYVKEKR
ncbi:hypothetical protein D3C75_333020 [compost metagenome]